MTRGKKLLILLFILLMAAMGLFAASHFTKQKDGEKNDLQITDIQTASLRSVTWTFSGETVKIISENGKDWQLDGDKDFPLSSDKAADMAAKVSSLKAVKTIPGASEDLSTYGLTNPKISITVKTDTEEIVLHIGNYNNAAGYYYFKCSGRDALYYVDSALYTAFSVNQYDIVEFEFPPEINTGDVKKIELQGGGKNIALSYYPNGRDAYHKAYTYFIDGSDVPCDTDAVTAMINGFINISWLSCEKYHISENDIEQHGLASPCARFTMHYAYEKESEEPSGESETVRGRSTLLIGKQQENGKYFAMLENGKCIYTISEETAKNYLITGEESLYSKKLLDLTEESIADIQVTYRGENYRIKAASTGKVDSDGEDIEVLYTLGDKRIDLHPFVALAAALKAESVQRTEIADAGEQLISIRFTMTDDTTQSLMIYAYDNSLSAVSLGNELKYFAKESECDDICDAFRDAVNGL